MTTFKQFEANRRNALKSTGPITDAGKQRSRRNAVRHGLTAETVITTLEDEEDYKAFELSVTSGFDSQTAVERELVLRLASLLWRLRRATAIDTGLIQMQSEILDEIRHLNVPQKPTNQQTCEGASVRSAFLRSSHQPDLATNNDPSEASLAHFPRHSSDGVNETLISSSTHIARCFLRLANVDNGAFDRANRYETALWRQIGQILLMLDFLRRTGAPSGRPIRWPRRPLF